MKERLLRLRQVIEETGMSRSAIYARPDFPRSLKISDRASAWLETEVQGWIKTKIAARADSAKSKP